jgi:gas vesicle protein
LLLEKSETKEVDAMTFKQGFKYFGVALVAGGIGGLVGMLFAPASGRETRRMVSRRMGEVKEDFVKTGERFVGDVVHKAEETMKEVGRRIA